MDARKLTAILAAAALILAAPVTLSQTYPIKPVRLVVPFAAGGTTDVVARLLTQKLSERLGQPVIVENRPGGDTIIGAEAVAKAAPDGHTIFFTTSSTIAILPHTRKQLPYDPFKSFVHVAQIAYIQFVLAVNPSVPAASVAELIALARSRPGRLTYARGSESGHITAEMFKAATPAFAVKKLNEEIGAVLQMPDIVEKMLAQGAEPRHGTPEQFTALLRADWEKQRGVLQRIGFKAE